jgi:hypothetical protein
MAFIFAQTAPALAHSTDRDGLSNSIERNVTETNPRDADTDNDRIKDGNEDEDDDCDELEDEEEDDD